MAARSLNQRVALLERKLKAQIREIRDEIEADYWDMRWRVLSLERRMQYGAEAVTRLLDEGKDVDMRIMLVHEGIVAKLVALEESRDGAGRPPTLNMTPASDPARDRMSGAKP